MIQLRHGLCMCAIQRVNGQDKILKYLSAVERGMVVGARSTGLTVSRTATLLGFSRLTVSRVYQEWSTTQKTSSQLDTTVGRKHWSQHGPASLWNTFDTLYSPCPDGLRLFWGHKFCVHLNIRKVFLMFCTLSVYHQEFHWISAIFSLQFKHCIRQRK